MPQRDTPGRSKLIDASRHAEQTGQHPGHWHLHHLALPAERPGDFTPFRTPEYAEDAATPHGELWRFLAKSLLGLGATQRVLEHQAGLEAGQ
jgi:hypothetical protein